MNLLEYDFDELIKKLDHFYSLDEYLEENVSAEYGDFFIFPGIEKTLSYFKIHMQDYNRQEGTDYDEDHTVEQLIAMIDSGNSYRIRCKHCGLPYCNKRRVCSFCTWIYGWYIELKDFHVGISPPSKNSRSSSFGIIEGGWSFNIIDYHRIKETTDPDELLKVVREINRPHAVSVENPIEIIKNPYIHKKDYAIYFVESTKEIIDNLEYLKDEMYSVKERFEQLNASQKDYLNLVLKSKELGIEDRVKSFVLKLTDEKLMFKLLRNDDRFYSIILSKLSDERIISEIPSLATFKSLDLDDMRASVNRRSVNITRYFDYNVKDPALRLKMAYYGYEPYSHLLEDEKKISNLLTDLSNKLRYKERVKMIDLIKDDYLRKRTVSKLPKEQLKLDTFF